MDTAQGTYQGLQGRPAKPNGYRSLHTNVFCEDGEIVEFQIRTKEMHAMNEFGIDWAYDEHGTTALIGGNHERRNNQ